MIRPSRMTKLCIHADHNVTSTDITTIRQTRYSFMAFIAICFEQFASRNKLKIICECDGVCAGVRSMYT